MAGIEQIPLRIPDRWDPVWFERFVREVLALADARNAQPGPGISISGNPNEPAVISGSANVDVIADADFVLAEANNELANAGDPRLSAVASLKRRARGLPRPGEPP